MNYQEMSLEQLEVELRHQEILKSVKSAEQHAIKIL